MKISVITVLNTRNYGTVLQTCATQEVFRKLRHDVEFVDYYRCDQTIKAGIDKNRKFSHHAPIVKSMFIPIFAMDQICRKYVFRSFLKRRVKLSSKSYYSNEELKVDTPIADIYCTGSDQMWNSAWNNGLEKAFFLDYVPNGKKRISLSTSIGKTDWQQEEADETVPLLQNYDYITVREETAKQLLGKYGIKSKVILDPTLLVDREFWVNMAGATAPIKEKYLFVYKLHQKHGDVNFDEYVKKIALEKGLKIKKVEYGFVETIKRKHESIYLPSPEQFVQWLSHAEYVVTDSFHATAFSINMNRQISVVCPEQFSTRIRNILKLTNLESRIKTVESMPEECTIDYSISNKIMREEREKSLSVIGEMIGQK